MLARSSRGASDPPTYASAVLANSPSVYYRLDDLSTGAAHDISGHGDNGTYVSNDTPVAGALASDPTDQAVQSSSNADNRVMTASDAGLPAGASDRTIEVASAAELSLLLAAASQRPVSRSVGASGSSRAAGRAD
jgi:hypothetical protein